jgi:ATP-dependent Clp protease, protease subunit
MISNTESKGAETLKKIDEFNAEDRVGVELLKNSIHYLSGDITEENISETIRWIIYENLQKNHNKILTLYISSLGGDLYSALGLIDIMKNSTVPIRTLGVGPVMSAAFLIFVSGTKGERYAGKNASFMCHQYSDSPEGKHHDLRATMKEGDNLNARMVEILKDATGLTASQVKSKLLPATDVYLTSQEAINLGAADHLL